MALNGDVKALIQANNGNVLAGTNTSASIYRSTDNGQNWTHIVTLGSSSDSVNAFAKERGSGYLYAAVSGSSGSQGIWRSQNNGSSWLKVKSHPSNTGYKDVAIFQEGNRIIAVGNPTSFSESPVVFSNNQGSTWQNISPRYWLDHIAVATMPDPVLFSRYPNETELAAQFFIGVDSFYTEMWGVSSVPSAIGFSTLGGGSGNGGLDMTALLFKHASGQYYRNALWAVRSHLNTANTEIWRWPAAVTGPYSFAKVATITGEIFNVLYTDPVFNWQNIGPLRTVWAGSDGKIWVSYNSGLSWAIATESPSGEIYSFVRTTDNILIAGGESGEIFIFGGSGSEGGGSDSGGGGGEEEDPPPIIVDPGLATSRILGRGATTEDEVFVSNKFSFSNINHIFYYNGSTYTNLQFATEPPYNLFGGSAVVGRVMYFGSKNTDENVPGGPFSSLIFNLSQGNLNFVIIWEYWNGSAWVTLTTTDNTDQFRNLGVNSVSWQIPSNWAANTINSIEGFWVRARISSVSTGSQTPIQEDRYIYTTLLPYIQIASSQILGDMPALGRIRVSNNSGIDIERMICGLRKLDRGPNFNAYINISDRQTLFGMTINPSGDTGVSWQNSVAAPTGRSLLISYTESEDLNQWNDLVTITLNTTIAQDYFGYYRAFVRCFYNNAGSQGWNLRVQLRLGSGGTSITTKSIYPTTIANFEVIDLGPLAIATRQISAFAGGLADQMQLVIQGYCIATSRPLTLYDLILIPTDEWGVDTRVPQLITTGSPEIINQNYLDIDSITNPKIAISTANRTPAGLIVSQYQAINNGPVIFQKEADQRLWFLALTYENYWRGYPEVINSVQAFKQQQYLGFRGKN